MKKFLMMMLLLILPLALTFSGESQTLAEEKTTGFIQVQTVSYADGGVLQGFYFSANEKFLTDNGATQSDIQSFRLALKSNINRLKNLMVANFTLIYVQNPKAEYAIGEGGGLQISSVYDQVNDAYGFQLYFKDRDAWDFYHPKSNDDQDLSQSNKQESFVSTERSQGQIIFAQELSGYQGTVGQYFQQLYLSAVQGTDVSQSYNPLLIYDYAISSSKVHSNADSTYSDVNGLYHHLWQRTIQSSIENDQIVLYYYQVHAEWWYLTIIGAAVMIVLVGCGIVMIRNRKQKIKREQNFQ